MTNEATLKDLERTAALLEGRLSGAERDAAMARIEADEGLREVFADLVRFRAEGAADVAPVSQPRVVAPRWGWRTFLPLAAAAAIAVVVLLPRRDGWTGPLTVDRLTPAVDSATLPVPAGWYEHAWDVPRGGGIAPRDAGSASFRLGVRLQEVASAVAAGDSADAAIVGGRLKGLLDRLPGMQPAAVEVAAVVRDVGSTDAATLVTRLAAVDRMLADRRDVDPGAFALGKWAAAGRLAAMTGGANAIPAAPPALLREAERLSGSDADRSRALRDLRTALARGDAAGRSKQARAFTSWIDRF